MNKELLKMDLQFFADENAEVDQPEPVEEEQVQDAESTEEKLLTQDEVNRIVAQRTSRAKDEARKEIEKEYQDAIEKAREEGLTEGQRLANMTEEEKEDVEKQKLLDQLAEYERKENLREMTDQASKLLEDEGVTGVSEVLPFFITEKAETTKENVQALAKWLKARDEAIKDEVLDSIGTRSPIGGTAPSSEPYGAQVASQHNQSKVTDVADPWNLN